MYCLGNVACFVIEIDMQVHTVHTNVGAAMIEALIVAHEKNPNTHGKVKGYISDAWAKNKHTYKRNDWNANLSFRTAKKLKEEGILV